MRAVLISILFFLSVRVIYAQQSAVKLEVVKNKIEGENHALELKAYVNLQGNTKKLGTSNMVFEYDTSAIYQGWNENPGLRPSVTSFYSFEEDDAYEQPNFTLPLKNQLSINYELIEDNEGQLTPENSFVPIALINFHIKNTQSNEPIHLLTNQSTEAILYYDDNVNIVPDVRLEDFEVDLQEQTPTVLLSQVLSLFENAQNPVQVGEIAVQDQNNYVIQLIEGYGDDFNDNFSIENNIITSNFPINYEEHNQVNIRVRAESQGSVQVVEEVLVIDVVNRNDAPTAVLLDNNQVEENLPLRSLVGTFSTEDEDANDRFRYFLVSGDGDVDNRFFEIEEDRLVTNRVFDFENRDTYSIRIRTLDRGGLSFEEAFQINIQNVNDAPSAIAISNSSILENNAIGAAIGIFSSEDDEIGEAANHTYSLVEGEGSSGNPFFEVDGNTLRATASFDREEKLNHSIRVRARDEHGATTDKNFIIQIVNEREAPEGLTITSSRVFEEQIEGTLVGSFLIAEPDSEGEYFFQLTGGLPDNSSFSIQDNKLLSREVFDYEDKNQYLIQVKASDRNDNNLSTIENFTIRVKNLVNEPDQPNHPPENISLSSLEIIENQPLGTLIGNISVEDPDLTNNHTLELVNGDAYFSIQGNQLISNVSFNYEEQKGYIVVIRADDGFGGTKSKALTINVLDVSESPTDIILSANTINENAASGTLVGSLETVDPDENETYTYSLIERANYPDNDYFLIEENQLLSSTTFNFEDKNEYIILVETDDQRGNAFQKELNIRINDRNDAPTQIILSQNRVEENLVNQAQIGELSTIDEDENEEFSYSIVGNARFFVEGNILFASEPFNYEEQSEIEVAVEVSDKAGETLTNAVQIQVIDTNDSPSDIFISSNTIVENQESEIVVGLLSALDEDQTIQGHQFQIAESHFSSFFRIEGNELLAIQSFNYERVNEIFLPIVVIDQGGGNFEKQITIEIINANDAPTGLELSSTELRENVEVGSIVATLIPLDEDQNDSHIYTIINENDSEFFSIQGNSLILEKKLDFEIKPSLDIIVEIEDQGGEKSRSMLNIALLDVPEGPQDAILDNYSVVENAVGVIVGDFVVEDPDLINNYSFYLASGDNSEDNALFSISGKFLLTKKVLNYERDSLLQIRVRILDRDSQKELEKEFTIRVIDQNDMPNDITLSSYSFEENLSIGTSIATFEAIDEDRDENFIFSLDNENSDNQYFRIEGFNLLTNTSFNYEGERKAFHIKVNVRDKVDSSFTKEITLRLIDTNDTPTKILISNDQIAENIPIGSRIGFFQTEDEDQVEYFKYRIVEDTESAFEAIGNELRSKKVFDFEEKESYKIIIESKDSKGAKVMDSLVINILDKDESFQNQLPTSLTLSNLSILSGTRKGSRIGQLTTADPDDSDGFRYQLVYGEGSTHNYQFSIVDDLLLTEYDQATEGGDERSIRIRSTDSKGGTIEKIFQIIIIPNEEFSISGIIKDKEGEGQSRQRVILYQVEESGFFSEVKEVRTEEGGSYSFHQIVGGNYILGVQPSDPLKRLDNYLTTYLGGKVIKGDANRFVLNSNLSNQDITLIQKETHGITSNFNLSGKAYELTNNQEVEGRLGIPFLIVNAQDQVIAAATSATGGNFSFNNLSSEEVYYLLADYHSINSEDRVEIKLENESLNSSIRTVLSLTEMNAYFTKSEVLGVKDNLSKYGITLYPNPANEKIQLTFNNDYFGDIQISILNTSGKEIKTWQKEKRGETEVIPLEIQYLPSGNYLMKVKMQQKEGIDLFIKN